MRGESATGRVSVKTTSRQRLGKLQAAAGNWREHFLWGRVIREIQDTAPVLSSCGAMGIAGKLFPEAMACSSGSLQGCRCCPSARHYFFSPPSAPPQVRNLPPPFFFSVYQSVHRCRSRLDCARQNRQQSRAGRNARFAALQALKQIGVRASG